MDEKPFVHPIFGVVIHAYTRADALADGTLIDVTATAHEAGLRHPVALTAAVWEQYVRVPDGVTCQDEPGRLWDVLWMLRCAAARANGSTLLYQLHIRNDNREGTLPLVTLKAVCGPGDDGKPVVTIMLPDED